MSKTQPGSAAGNYRIQLEAQLPGPAARAVADGIVRVRLELVGADGGVLEQTELAPREAAPRRPALRAPQVLALGIGATVLLTATLAMARSGPSTLPDAAPTASASTEVAPQVDDDEPPASSWHPSPRKFAREIAIDDAALTITVTAEDRPAACRQLPVTPGASLSLQGRWQATLPEGAEARAVLRVTRANAEKPTNTLLARLQADADWTPLGGATVMPADATALELCLMAHGDGAVLRAEGVGLE